MISTPEVAARVRCALGIEVCGVSGLEVRRAAPRAHGPAGIDM